jgi:hypothetical protein
MAVTVDGSGSISGLDAIDVSVYADDVARDAALTSPVEGQIVFVTGEGTQVYNGSSWAATGKPPSATFSRVTSSSTVSTPEGFDFVDLLIVGGGQAGTNSGRRGSGGAGGVVHTVTNIPVTNGLSIVCTIGGGGSPQAGAGTASTVVISGTTYTSASGSSVGAQARGIVLTSGLFTGATYAGGGAFGGMDGDGGTNQPGIGGGAGVYHRSDSGNHYVGSAGWVNSGGGGGGGAFSSRGGYAGGSGIIILGFHN